MKKSFSIYFLLVGLMANMACAMDWQRHRRTPESVYQYGQTQIVVCSGDITKQPVDAIVNAANTSLLGGGGIDGAIHTAAGPNLVKFCSKLSAANGIRCPVGKAKVSPAFNLEQSQGIHYIIHTVGPRGTTSGKEKLLANAYANSLKLACDQQMVTSVAGGNGRINSIAFCAISVGIYAYPKDEATRIAINTIIDQLRQRTQTGQFVPQEIRFVIYQDQQLFDLYNNELHKALTARSTHPSQPKRQNNKQTHVSQPARHAATHTAGTQKMHCNVPAQQKKFMQASSASITKEINSMRDRMQAEILPELERYENGMQKVLNTILKQSTYGTEAIQLITQSNKILSCIRALAKSFECAYLQNSVTEAKEHYQKIIEQSKPLFSIKEQMLALRKQSKQFAQTHAIPSAAPGKSSLHDISQTRAHHHQPMGGITYHQPACATTSTHVPAAANALSIHPLDCTQIRGVLINVPDHCKYTPAQLYNAGKIKEIIDAALNRDLHAHKTGFYQVLEQAKHDPRHVVTIYSPAAFLLEEIRVSAKQNSFVSGILDALAECPCARYDRINAPETRGKCEEEMFELVQQHLNPHALTTCTFIGAGELFSVIFKVSKLLDQGYHNLRINLIDNDPEYQLAVQQLKGMKLEDLMNTLEQPRPFRLINFHGHQVAMKSRANGIQCPYQALQWFSFLRETYYHDAIIEVAIYKNMQDYAQDCCEDKNTQADILIIEDLDISDHTIVILPAVDKLLQQGGIYAILADTCIDIPYEKALNQAGELLSITIPMDDLLGCNVEKKSLSYFEDSGRAALTRRYVGIKQF